MFVPRNRSTEQFWGKREHITLGSTAVLRFPLFVRVCFLAYAYVCLLYSNEQLLETGSRQHLYCMLESVLQMKRLKVFCTLMPFCVQWSAASIWSLHLHCTLFILPLAFYVLAIVRLCACRICLVLIYHTVVGSFLYSSNRTHLNLR